VFCLIARQRGNPAARHHTWSGAAETVTLAALGHPEAIGALDLVIPIASGRAYYTVEFRRSDRWDTGIPADAAVLHQMGTDGIARLVDIGGGPRFLTCEYFQDKVDNFTVLIEEINPTFNTARVRIVRTARTLCL